MRRSASNGRMCRSCRNARIASIRIWSPSGSSTYSSGCARRSTRPGSPSNAPANPSAARRFPTPGGPWNRYACAVPSASAASSSRCASACSGNPWKPIAHLLRNLLDRPRAVEHPDPPRQDRAQLTVRLVDLAQELVALALDPIAGRAGAPPRLLGIDQQKERHVRKDASDRVHVQREHTVDAEPARDALIGERRVEVAIADDVRAPLERRLDHLGHELGPRRGEQRCFRPRRDLRPVQDDLAHALPELRPARLPRQHDLAPRPLEVLPEKLRLRGSTGAVEALERHEHRLRIRAWRCSSPEERASSARTSPRRSPPAARRSWSSTTSRRASARTC